MLVFFMTMFILQCDVQVVVQVPGAAPLELRLPFGVDAKLGSAALEDEGRRLCLRLPFKPYRSFIEEV